MGFEKRLPGCCTRKALPLFWRGPSCEGPNKWEGRSSGTPRCISGEWWEISLFSSTYALSDAEIKAETDITFLALQFDILQNKYRQASNFLVRSHRFHAYLVYSMELAPSYLSSHAQMHNKSWLLSSSQTGASKGLFFWMTCQPKRCKPEPSHCYGPIRCLLRIPCDQQLQEMVSLANIIIQSSSAAQHFHISWKVFFGMVS